MWTTFMHYTHSCSLPWGILSLNVNSGKTCLPYFWVLCLIVHAIMCYITGDFFVEMVWTTLKVARNPLQSWIQFSAGSAGSLHFSQNFGLVKDNRIGCARGIYINAISTKRNKWCIFLIWVKIWNQRKRWLGSWHMSDYTFTVHWNVQWPGVNQSQNLSSIISRKY